MPIGNPISLTDNVASKIITVTATAAQTTFTVTGGYRINAISVFQNGVRLTEGTDFTASDASTVVLTSGATNGDELTFHVFDDFRVADAIVSAASTQTLSGNLAVTGSLNVQGGVTGASVGIQSAGTVIGTATTLNFIGTGNTFAISGNVVDISIAGGGGGGGGDGSQFNTGITTTVIFAATGIGTTALTLPATADTQYLVYSIFATNVATGNTEVNMIGAFDFTSGYGGGQRSYFAYNIPVPTGTSIELLEQPQILNANDRITIRSTDYSRAGTDDIVKVFITYEEKTSSTAYFGVGISTTGLGVTTPVGVYTSSTYPSVVQSIRLVNKTDTGSYPVTVDVTTGASTTKLVDNLIIPKYGSVELLAQPKRLHTDDVIKITVDQAETIEAQISGKQITS